MESWIENKGSAVYRFEKKRCWPEDIRFENGDAVVADPFPNVNDNCRVMRAMHCTFVEYADDEEKIAKVWVPEASDDRNWSCWFKEEAGEYLIHEGYLRPQ